MSTYVFSTLKDTGVDAATATARPGAPSAGTGRAVADVEKAAQADVLTNAFTVRGTADQAYGGRCALVAQAGTDTHVVAEVLDEVEKAAEIEKLRAFLRLQKYAASAGGTPTAPVTVTGGLVFVDFPDLTGGDIAPLRDKLVGARSGAASALDEFVKRESGGRVVVDLRTYSGPPPAATPAWVRLPKKADDYRRGAGEFLTADFLTDVDAAVAFPDDWAFVIFAFPAVTSSAGANLKELRSHCSTNVFDPSENAGLGQNMPYIAMAPKHYDDAAGAHVTTIHETMHALGLLDLYSMDLARSFGWSMMSAAGAGIHLTGLEKLVLGWDPPQQYQFLRRGLLSAALAPQGSTTGVKGVVLLPDPDAGRPDYHYLELAQGVGVGQANRDAYAAAWKADPGVLVLAARVDGRFGIVTPVVARRPADLQSEADKYGGASRAPFVTGDQLQRNGFTLVVRSAPDPATQTVTCLIGADRGFRPEPSASLLRERERIVNDDRWFALDSTGAPQLSGSIVLDGDEKPLAIDLKGNDYGHSVFVTETGSLCIARSLDRRLPADRDVRLRITPATPSTPARGMATNSGLGTGGHYFSVMADGDGTRLDVNRMPDGAGAVLGVFTALRTPRYSLSRGWKGAAAPLRAAINDDGNVSVFQGTEFLEGSYQVYDRLRPAQIGLTSTGSMYWADADGTVLRSFSGTPGTGPFTLAVDGAAATAWDLVVKDAKSTTLHSVYGRVERGWSVTEGGATVAFGTDGAITLTLGGKVLVDTRTAFGQDVGTPARIRFESDGRMSWLKSDGSRLISFKGAAGVGPYRLGVDTGTGDPGPSLVVKDSAGKVLYPVLGYRADRLWAAEDDSYQVRFGDDGNIGVLAGQAFVTGTYQAFGDAGLPKYLSFDATGTLSWRAVDGALLRSFSGTAGTGPFRLAVDVGADGRWSLVVKDSTGTSLYPVLGHRFERGWTTTDGVYTIAFAADGTLTVSKTAAPAAAFTVGSDQIFDQGRPKAITVDAGGTVTWLGTDDSVLKTFAGTAGKAPFTPYVDTSVAHRWDLVLRDADGKNRTRLFGGLERTWSATTGRLTALFSDDGNVQVRDTGFLTGSYQLYGTLRPQAIAFSDDGRMVWLDASGKQVKVFAGARGQAPFSLAPVAAEDGRWDLVVQDSRGTSLCLVYGFLRSGWTSPVDANGFQVSLSATGRPTVRKGADVVLDGDTEFADQEVATYLALLSDGSLQWQAGNATLSTKATGKAGRGPFRLAVDGVQGDGWDLVVKDATGASLWTVRSRAPK